VRRRHEHGDRRNDGEAGEGDEAEAVDDHGCKLPVHDHVFFFVTDLHPVRDEFQLLQGRNRMRMHSF